jgi:CRP-like cAMP-binding protein
LQPFAAAYLRQIAGLAQLVEHDAGEVIFAEGQPERFIYLILKGAVALDIKVPDFEDIYVHRVGPGELLGWSPLLGRRAMTATARALTRCRLAALDAERVAELAEKDPRFGLEFFRAVAGALAERLHATRLHLAANRRHPITASGYGAD